jgi:hypothetical protein
MGHAGFIGDGVERLLRVRGFRRLLLDQTFDLVGPPNE